MSAAIPLSTMMGTYPKTTALKDKRLTSAQVELQFAPVDVAQKAFKAVVREHAFEVAEVAIMTFLQAFDAGAPYLLLPFVMNGGFHHKSILCREDSDLRPEHLAGKRVAMRAWTQTTPTWVRGLLTHEYGVALPEVQWLSQEGAHVASYEEPAWVTRIESDRNLEQLLRAGEVDAIIAGGGLSGEPGLRPLIASPADTALAWHARTGVVPINHVVAMRRDAVAAHPEAVAAVYALLVRAREHAAGTEQGKVDLQPHGFAALQPALEMAIALAFEQKLISRSYSVAELYGSVSELL
ncbi:hypothetical protein [Pseudomonas japonica]|uniref:hypothetical protein n=1 Tax=Pseudomonas japonica TaxID=256466 RepID=UPI0015E36D32|nr:hypothetical protein [Pseudomonas japonica]MBA1242602.1 hypothetical protein [Pseudomonas japonica]MBA1289212.1 hypothetical protein [Pseudomonas japonica]